MEIKSVLKSKEKDENKKKILELKFNDIFLVFDMDPHAGNETEKLKKMLIFFNNSTDNGKLYLNYPMLESYKHLKSMDDDEFRDRCVKIRDIKDYKQTVNCEACEELKYCGHYTKETFETLARTHLKKANYIVMHTFSLPKENEFSDRKPTSLFDAQCKFVNEKSSVFVLNTSLFCMIDYAPSYFLKKD